jgi:hypothetical protein
VDYFHERPWVPPQPLAPAAADYYHRVLEMHANKPPYGRCIVCGEYCCPDWRDAYDKLALAGYPMSVLAPWRDDEPTRR